MNARCIPGARLPRQGHLPLGPLPVSEVLGSLEYHPQNSLSEGATNVLIASVDLLKSLAASADITANRPPKGNLAKTGLPGLSAQRFYL